DAFLVDERTHVEQALPAGNLAADHPVERAAVDQLIGALGHHAGAMHVLAGKAALLAVLEPLADPLLEVLDRVATDAKLDEIEGHDDGRTWGSRGNENIAWRVRVPCARGVILSRSSAPESDQSLLAAGRKLQRRRRSGRGSCARRLARRLWRRRRQLGRRRGR